MKKICTLFVLFSVLCVLPLFAEYNRLGVPDSTVIRRAVADKWFDAPLSELRQFRSEIRSNEIGERFQVRLEETAFQFAIIVAPETQMSVDFYTEKGKESRVVAQYPGDACGSWILYRDTTTGKPLKSAGILPRIATYTFSSPRTRQRRWEIMSLTIATHPVLFPWE